MRPDGVNCFKYWWLQKSRSYTLREIENEELRGLEGHKKSVMTVLRIDGQLMRSSHSVSSVQTSKHAPSLDLSFAN